MLRIDFGKECIGCGACVDACPEVFEFDTDLYKAKLNPAADYDKYESQIQDAIDSCPVDNIKIRK